MFLNVKPACYNKSGGACLSFSEVWAIQRTQSFQKLSLYSSAKKTVKQTPQPLTKGVCFLLLILHVKVYEFNKSKVWSELLEDNEI